MLCFDVVGPAANDPYSFRCKVCAKDVSCAHQGERDLTRHVGGNAHLSKFRAKSAVTPITFVKQDSHTDVQARKADVKFTGFLAEHNLPLATADRPPRLTDSLVVS